MRTRGFESESCGPSRQVRATLADGGAHLPANRGSNRVGPYLVYDGARGIGSMLTVANERLLPFPKPLRLLTPRILRAGSSPGVLCKKKLQSRSNLWRMISRFG